MKRGEGHSGYALVPQGPDGGGPQVQGYLGNLVRPHLMKKIGGPRAENWLSEIHYDRSINYEIIKGTSGSSVCSNLLWWQQKTNPFSLLSVTSKLLLSQDPIIPLALRSLLL